MRIILITFLLTIIGLQELDAQRRSRRRDRDRDKMELDEERLEFKDRIFGELKFGNIGFGSSFSLSFKPTVGMKVNKHLMAGINAQYFYSKISFVNAPSLSSTDFGIGAFARGFVSESIYLQAEFTSMSFDDYYNGAFIQSGERIDFPTISGGYLSGVDKWKYGIQIGYVLTEDTDKFNYGGLMYWVGFAYNL